MPCFRPLHGWRGPRNPSGKRSIVFSGKHADFTSPVTVPCGRCIGCRLERSRQWAIRCVHEATLYDHNLFLTLTYNDKHLPSDLSLRKSHFQSFMKDLRHAVFRKRRRYWTWDPRIISDRRQKLRYFHCGEYGEQLGRPHYHACVFNFNLSDKKLWKKTSGGDLYVSETLNEIWGKGFCVVGSVTFDSAAYVARYITKKITGEAAEVHYGGKQPEYTTMSKGIGRGWYERYKTDTYPSDTVIMRGKEMQPPKFYDKRFELDSPEIFAKVKAQRLADLPPPWDPELGSARMAVKEKVQELNLKSLNRSYEK